MYDRIIFGQVAPVPIVSIVPIARHVSDNSCIPEFIGKGIMYVARPDGGDTNEAF